MTKRTFYRFITFCIIPFPEMIDSRHSISNGDANMIKREKFYKTTGISRIRKVFRSVPFSRQALNPVFLTITTVIFTEIVFLMAGHGCFSSLHLVVPVGTQLEERGCHVDHLLILFDIYNYKRNG